MKTKESHVVLPEELHVLMVGNNPIDLGRVFDTLHRIPEKRVVTEIAFDVKTIIQRLGKFTPNFIVIDDNIGKVELRNSVQALLRLRKTKRIPITLLKNSNYHEAINSGILNYVLKTNLNADSLYKALKNSIKFRQTQRYLNKAYRKRKGQLTRLIGY